MSFRFTIKETLESKRIGELALTRSSQEDKAVVPLETPNFFKYTRRGLQPHLVNEVARDVSRLPMATRVQLEDFLENEMPDCAQYPDGLHKFIGLDTANIVLLDTLDPTITARVAKSTNRYLAVDSEGGIKRLSPERFGKVVNALSPDVYIPLADYIEDPLPSLTQGKRISKSVDRSLKWLDQFIAEINSPSGVLAPVMGSHSPELRERFSKELAKRAVDGYAFNDASLALPFEKKLELACTSLAHLDPAKPRYMVGVSSPDRVVRAIQAGMDLFDSTYPYAVTEQGFASTYLFNSSNSSAIVDKDGTGHLDLWDLAMFEDFGPLVKGCECFTCKNHHRSYIHHLLMTKEMLATVLLQIHNIHWYQMFFDDLRASLAAGHFDADAEAFLGRYGCLSGDNYVNTNRSAEPEPPSKRAFSELETLSGQSCTPTTKIQRKRFIEGSAASQNAASA